MLQQTHKILLEIQTHTTNDSLIYWQAETLIKVVVFVILIVATLIIKFLSSRLEHAIIFALFTSIIAIAFFIIH